jgi:flavin-dependent dehydrogenase
VVGADGRHSLVARAVQPVAYRTLPPLSCAYYTYYSGVPLEGGELYMRERRLIGAWPTNDGLTLIYTAWPIAEFHQYRADIEGNFLKTLALAPSLAERVQQGRRAERFMGIADLPNFYRTPYGPGWALVGDAGYHKDPITRWGISDAFRDADLLAEALDAGFAGRAALEEALAGYEAQRNAASLPSYELTTQLASFAPPRPEHTALYAALRRDQAARDQFFGVLTGAVPMQTFFTPGNLVRILGLTGMARTAGQKVWRALRPSGQPRPDPQSGAAA